MDDSGEESVQHQVPRDADEVLGGLLSISPLLSQETLYHRLEERGKLGRDQIAIGATTIGQTDYLLDDDHQIDGTEDRGDLELDSETEYDQLFKDSLSGEVDLDA